MEPLLWMLHLLTVLLAVLWLRVSETAVTAEEMERSMQPCRF
jgi:hypothetical protein